MFLLGSVWVEGGGVGEVCGKRCVGVVMDVLWL